MPFYSYKAKKGDGEAVTGTLQAESERAALDTLYRQGVYPLEIRDRDQKRPERAERAQRRRLRGVGQKPKRDDVAMFMRQLADLLRAGVSLHQALVTLERQTSHGGLAKIIDDVGQEVRAGRPLHEAMAKHPEIFSALFVSMVKAGESGGFLEDVLLRLAEFTEKDSELRGRVRAALAYPVLLIILGTAAVAFLMVFFIPRFSAMFQDLGSELPGITQVVISVSGFLRDYWVLPFAAILIGLFAYKRLGETVAGRRTIDRIKVQTPLFGDVILKSAISRFSRTLGTLLKCGVPIIEALDVSKDAMGNRYLMEDVEEAGAGVTKGRTLADMLRGTKTFPPMVVDMVAVGEEGGNLDEVLVNVADSYDRQVDRAVRVFLALFEPILLLFMACIVGIIVISMLLPVFTLSTTIR